MADTINYLLWIETGEQNLAGTDSDVFIQITGTQGQTDPIHLPEQDIFSFESGQTDKYVLQIPDLGDLKRCCIGHNNSEGDSGWYVKSVRLQHEDSGKSWTFTFDQWLGVEESGKLSECIDL